MAITDVISKLLEKCIKQTLLRFLNKHDIIYPNQQGFHENMTRLNPYFAYNNLNDKNVLEYF